VAQRTELLRQQLNIVCEVVRQQQQQLFYVTELLGVLTEEGVSLGDRHPDLKVILVKFCEDVLVAVTEAGKCTAVVPAAQLKVEEEDGSTAIDAVADTESKRSVDVASARVTQLGDVRKAAKTLQDALQGMRSSKVD
jgi:hypothetical protein